MFDDDENDIDEEFFDDPTKYCPKCQTEKDLLRFSKNKARKDGVQNYCKECEKKRLQKYREKRGR